MKKIRKEIENTTFGVWVTDNGDGTVDVQGIINLENKNLTNLDIIVSEIGIINELDGHFYCNMNSLKSLKGAPRIITGYFYCNDNQLTSLEGGPEQAHYYDCSINNLKSLKGAPNRVTGYFSCKNNPNLFFTEYEIQQISCQEIRIDHEQLINDDTIRDHMPF